MLHDVVIAGLLNVVEMDRAIREYFGLLRSMAMQHAANAGVQIKTIVRTYPSYLCTSEQSGDLDKYMTYYDKITSELWPGVKYETISEGNGAALFVSEAFHDPIFATNHTERRKFFEEMDRENGLNLIVADSGSSSLNLQVQNLYFNNDGYIIHSQSSIGTGWLKGIEPQGHLSFKKR